MSQENNKWKFTQKNRKSRWNNERERDGTMFLTMECYTNRQHIETQNMKTFDAIEK
jgi:hypothetical protein